MKERETRKQIINQAKEWLSDIFPENAEEYIDVDYYDLIDEIENNYVGGFMQFINDYDLQVLASDMPEKQQGDFCDEFYCYVDFDDRITEYPECCVWDNKPNYLLKGKSVEEWARNYYLDNKEYFDEISRDEAERIQGEKYE